MRFGHNCSISGDTICVQDRHDHIRSDRSITIEFAIPLRSDAIITISVQDLLRQDTCRCVLIRASRTDALCCDLLRFLDGCFERFRSRSSHDETATGMSTTWLISDLIVGWTSEHFVPLMMAGLVDDENVTFALLMFAYITTIEEEEEQLQEPQPKKVRRAIIRRTITRPVWVQPWITEERRQTLGQYSSLLDTHLRLEHPVAFQNYTRLTPQLFDEVLQRVNPAIERVATRFRQPLSPGLKLAATLRHLATGDSYRSLAYAFRCGVSSISEMVPEVCRAIVQAYKDEVFSLPVTPEAWKVIADQFEQRWNIPHAIGVLDGKHRDQEAPKHR